MLRKGRLFFLLPLVSLPLILFGFGSCSGLLGWGVLLWSAENPPIPSGTILPVYIRSNIDQVWVVGIPEQYRRAADSIDKFEVSLSRLEFLGRKKAAEIWAAAFSEFALLYGETLQDGLPVRENPDNSARRVYRLRQGQIVKILARVEGNPAISTTGDPLPGDWLRVLTEDGTTGYCFSYRLRLFEYAGGILNAGAAPPEETEDPDLEMVLSRTWSPESYETMVHSGIIDTEELAKQWGFSPGQDLGLARIHMPGLDRTFSYTGIRAEGNRSWRFEGTSLQMSLRSDTSLAVRFSDPGGALQTLLFVALPVKADDLILQETGRREALFRNLYDHGPGFFSVNYGALIFSAGGGFNWSGYNLLVPHIIPPGLPGRGTVDMGLFLAPSLSGRYDGAFSLRFDGTLGTAGEAPGETAGTGGIVLNFLYTLDDEGFRLEHVPADNLTGVTVTRRAVSPTVIYFVRSEETPAGPAPER
ncbi:MAG: SH3 domain-containing protein [Treponema sp.]|nr:SH3 domain-containing protein [Treponema sp.]